MTSRYVAPLVVALGFLAIPALAKKPVPVTPPGAVSPNVPVPPPPVERGAIAPVSATAQAFPPAVPPVLGPEAYAPQGNFYNFPTAMATSATLGQPQVSADPNAAGQGGVGLGQDNGTNPTLNSTMFSLRNEYYTLDGGNRVNATFARFNFPIYEKRGSLLFEVPYVYYNFDATLPGLPHVGGIGDVKTQASFNTWTSEDRKLTVVSFLEMYLPSADKALIDRNAFGNGLTAFNLATGKYVIGPGVGFVYAFSPNTYFAPQYFYEASIFGDEKGPDICRGKWRILGMYAHDNGVYVQPELQIYTNYLTGNNDLYITPEIGYSCKHTTIYFKPGLGLCPDPGDRQWGLEFGARVQF